MKATVVTLLAALAASVAHAAPALRVMQLTDIHYDRNYVRGASPSDSCYHGTSSASCEQFGVRSWSVDAPEALVNATAAYVASIQPPPDVLIWTGDSARHHHPNVSPPKTEEEIWNEVSYVTYKLREALPNTEIIPSIGNNDVWPHDDMAPGPNAVLGNLSAIWRPLLSSAEAEMMQNYGYFVRTVRPGLQVVSVNTITVAAFNAFAGDCDKPGIAATHLTWLENVLSSADAAGVAVILSGHVPPINWKPACAARYCQLTDKYESIIRAHLYGHYHDDEFHVIMRQSSSTPVGIVFVSPSVVPSFNPTVRMFELDDDWAVLDYHQYFAQLDTANAAGRVDFSLEYSAVSAYALTSFTPASWYDVFTNVQNGGNLKARFDRFRSVSSGSLVGEFLRHHLRLEEVDAAAQPTCILAIPNDDGR
eukprot:PLAT5685.1.p1 GENE.PLAT5685.1~~PLAT5685.1.p1  ORF type:complete len:421 (-),score=168.48 PLAT5685.1:165-1427(-)